jgi:hypothetical protein
MYALVQNNQIVKVFANPEGFTLNDNQYSAQIFTAWSVQEKQAIGIYEVITDSSNLKDERYYINTNEVWTFANNTVTRSFGTATPKQLEDVNAVDEKGQPVMQNGVQLVIKGLKSQKIDETDAQTYSALQSTDWYVTRKSDNGTAIPQNVIDYRNQVRTVSNQQTAAITACTTIEQLIALYTYTNTGTDVAPILTRPLPEFPKEI